MIFVFLGKKLISLDTILPVIAEVKSCNNNQKVVIIAPDEKTYDDIKKNITLYQYIRLNCHFLRLGGPKITGLSKYFQKILWTFYLLAIWLIVFFSNSKIIHFGLLEVLPRSSLKFRNKTKIRFFQSNCWGTSEFENRIQVLSYGNRRNNDVPKRENVSVFFNNSDIEPTGFFSNRDDLFCINPSKLWPAWNRFIDSTDKNQWIGECQRLNIDQSQRVVVFLLGTLDTLPFLNMSSTQMDDKLLKTLEVIQTAVPNITILLKPHVITEMARLDAVLGNLKSANAKVSYLHPQILAKHASIVICNYYSTALIDFWHRGVETVEFTRYGKNALKITNGGSMRPKYVDHFIDIDDTKRLNDLLKKTNSVEWKSKDRGKEVQKLTSHDVKLLRSLI